MIMELILIVLLVIILLILLLIIIPMHIAITLDDDKFIIKLYSIKIFKMSYSKLIATIINNPKSKININIKALLDSIYIETVEIYNPHNHSYDIEAMLYGAINILSSLYVKRVHKFIYKNQTNIGSVLINIKIKFQIGNVLLKQYQAMRKLKYGK